MKDALIFPLTTNKELARKVSIKSGIPLGESEVVRFSDGEIMARCLSNVKGKTCYIIQSTIAPSSDSLFEIFIFVDSLKNAGAKEINLITPYYGYSRQDRVARKGEPITAKIVANLLQSCGISQLISVDLHTQQIQGFFSIPVSNLETSELFGEYFVNKFNKLGIKHENVVVVSPDHGSANRGRDVSSVFNNASLAVIDKRRPAPNQSEVTNVVGDCDGKICLIIDDIIDTCGTINNATEALFKKGAKEIYVAATHAIFSKNSLDPRIKEFVTTDTVEKKVANATVLSVDELIAKAILSE